MPREKSAGAVIFRKDNGKTYYLLLHYGAGGHWDFPKGNIEEGEKEEEIVKREVKEETGIELPKPGAAGPGPATSSTPNP